MAITYTSATYVSATQFTVSGNYTNIFLPNECRVICNCGVDGVIVGDVTNSSYAGGLTTVTIGNATGNLTSNLTGVTRGDVDSSTTGALPPHDHDGTGGSGNTITESSVSDLDKYTKAEVNALLLTVSGTTDHTDLSNIGTNTHAEIDDHIADAGKHREINDSAAGATDLWSGEKITQELATVSGISNHDNTYHTETYITADGVTYENLDANGDIGTGVGTVASGSHLHTGTYSPVGHDHNDLYYTEAETDNKITTATGTLYTILSNEIDSDITTHAGVSDAHHSRYTDGEAVLATDAARLTLSGTLSNEIDADITTHASSADHDGRYYTEPEMDALLTSVSGVTDHGELDGLSDDDHTQYMLADGSRAFTGRVTGVSPTENNHLATKIYVQSWSSPYQIFDGGMSYVRVNDDDDISFKSSGYEMTWYGSGQLELNTGTRIQEFSTDTALGGGNPDDDTLPTEKAIKTYVDNGLSGKSGTGHTHSDYLNKDGSVALTDDWLFGSSAISGTGNIHAATFYGDGSNLTGIVVSASGSLHNTLSNLDYASSGHTGFTNETDFTTHSGNAELHFTKASINHSDINDDESTKHRLINDGGTSATELWSASKINSEITSISTDKILEGDSYVEVVDAGTGSVVVNVDGTNKSDWTSSGFRIGTSGARVTTIEDNDSLGTSDTKLCTQGNVKAYVDDNMPAGDLIEEGNTSVEVIDAGQGRVVFTTDGIERMRITQDGLVGINNDTPDGNSKLDIDGALKVGTTASGTSGIIRYTGSDFEGYHGGEWVSLTTGSGGAGGSVADKIFEGDTSVECVDTGTGSIEWKIDDNRVMYADYATGFKLFNQGADITEFSTDTTLGGNSDDAVPTEKAVKTYVDNNGGISDIVEDTTPELGGDLDFHAYTISGTGSVVVGDHGSATAASTVNVIYGTGDAPGAGSYPEGTVYIKYTA